MTEELRTKKVDFGIDLGTTTSIIAHCEGNDTPIIPNLTSNRNFTPSAVAIDDEGNIVVGESAKRQSLFDPENAAAEFKLKMGMDKKYHFKDSGIDLLPEELSAEVLKELKNSVLKQLDLKINSAVITVPADFSPIKITATEKAAKLAGFEFSPIIMEPVAAAYAYSNFLNETGTWLIYDLGGGTFDVSIVRLEEDEFLNLSHSGDERLGGNLIDWDIVQKIFAKKISDDLGLSDFNRNEKKYKKAFAKLKGAAEEAKKDLSRSDKAKVFVDSLLVHDNEIYDFKYTLKKNELEEIMKPYIKRTINHCNDAMKKAKLTSSDIDYIILVGGSTLSPIIRENIENAFDISLKFDIDPTTVVAKGAALFAGTIPDHGGGGSVENFALRLDYESTGPNEEFYVSGEVLSDKVDDFDGFTIEAVNVKTKRGTGKISVEDDGFFEFELLPEDETNKYSINLYDPTGSLVELDEASANGIDYKVSAGKPKIVLPHTLGLGLKNDKLFILAKEGSPLPYRNMEPFKTTEEIIVGDENTFISMPLYNGTAKVASNNQQIGKFLITGDMVKKTIRKGSEITITVDIDESRNTEFDVKVLDTGERFKFELPPYIPPSDFDKIKEDFSKAKKDYERIKSEYRSGNTNDEIEAYLNQIEEEDIIENINMFLENAENDEDELYQAEKLINKLKEILNNITSITDVDDIIERVQNLRNRVRNTVESDGSYEQQEKFERISNEVDEAIENKDYIRIEQLEDALMEIEMNCGDPCEKVKEALLYLVLFAEYKEGTEEMVSELKQEGMKAVSDDNCPAMANIGQQLMLLMKDGPKPPELDDDDDIGNLEED